MHDTPQIAWKKLHRCLFLAPVVVQMAERAWSVLFCYKIPPCGPNCPISFEGNEWVKVLRGNIFFTVLASKMGRVMLAHL